MKLKSILLIVSLFFLNSLGANENMKELKSVKPYFITFSVENIKNMKSWYINKLGFEVVKQKDYPEFNTSLVLLGLNGYMVELIKDGNAKQKQIIRPIPPKHSSVIGQTQFCFLTQNLDRLKNELIQNNVKIEWEYEGIDLGVKFLFIRDPEGNLIQYLQNI